MVFVVDKAALKRGFPPVIIPPVLLRDHVSFIIRRCYMDLAIDSDVKLNTSSSAECPRMS
jgi:hypothetical protein